MMALICTFTFKTSLHNIVIFFIFIKGGDSNNENFESASGDGENKESSGTDSGIKRINGTVDPEVNIIH